MLFDQRVEDLLTVGEEAVERGRGDAGVPGDGPGGDGVDATLLDQDGRGVQDPLHGLAAAGLDRLPAAYRQLTQAMPNRHGELTAASMG